MGGGVWYSDHRLLRGVGERAIVYKVRVVNVGMGSGGWTSGRHSGCFAGIGGGLFWEFKGALLFFYILRGVPRHFRDQPCFAMSPHQLHSLST